MIWTLALLSALALTLGYSVRQLLRGVQYLEVRDQLRFTAEAGVAKAVYVLKQVSGIQSSCDSLNDRWSRSEADFRDVPAGEGIFSVCYRPEGMSEPGEESSVVYGLVDEERKINLNRVKAISVLSKLFHFGAGLSDEEASALSASILDWRDEDEVLNDGGAESRYYRGLHPGYKAKNAEFDTLEELYFVKGVSPEVYRRIRPLVTLDSNGTVNVNTAPASVLIATGLSENLAKKILSFRSGRDKIEGTKDDRVFSDPATLAAELDGFLGLSDGEKESLDSFGKSGAVSVLSENFTICCSAHLRERREALTVTCVVDRQGVVRRWHERYHEWNGD
ncbi:MAG TPA: type II secretion system protein GspK [Candidatus Omnitrophota bacterium]|nr:type II secretion system protein GspK [Candidatus Omnitrophota bacterium]